MSFTRTAAQWAEFFKELPADEMVAVPFVWCKEDAEATLSIVTDDLTVELDEEEWGRTVHNYEDNERFNEDSTETMVWVLKQILEARKPQKEGN